MSRMGYFPNQTALDSAALARGDSVYGQGLAAQQRGMGAQADMQARMIMHQQEMAAQQNLMREQAQLGNWRANQDARRASVARVHGADLQAQLDAVQLGNRERQRLDQMRQAIDGVQSDPNLAPEEKQALVTQLRTGINPLENRQRQSQMLETQIRSQAMHQETQQRAQLFNQHQAWLARGIQGQLQTVVDPQTGREQLFHVDATGRIQPLDFSQSQQAHEMAMTTAGVNVGRTLQGMTQEADLHPHRVALARLSTEDLSQQINFRAQMQPWQLLNLEGEVRNRRQALWTAEQTYQQRGAMFPLELQRERATLDAMAEALWQSQGTYPYRLEGLRLGNIHTGLQNATTQAALDFQNRPLSQRVRTIYDPEEMQRVTDEVDARIRADGLEPDQFNPTIRQHLVEEALRTGGNGVHVFEHSPGNFRVEPHLNEGLNTNQERVARGHVMQQLNQDLRQFRAGPIRNPDGTTTPRDRPHWLDPHLLTGDLRTEWLRLVASGATELTPAMVRQLIDHEVERQVGPLLRRRGGANPAPAAGGADAGPPLDPAAAAAAAEAAVRVPGAVGPPNRTPQRPRPWYEGWPFGAGNR